MMIRYQQEFTTPLSTSGFDINTAISLALVCDLAYKNEDVVRAQANHWGYPKTEFISKRKGQDIDTQALILADDEHIVVAFRGSDSPMDWLANFQAVRDPGPFSDSLVHEGFQDSLVPALIAITNAIDKLRTNEQAIWLTGHSLGGAQAALYAGMLIENGYSVDGLYTYASPRPGNKRFCHQLNEKISGPNFRLVNKGDLVPHVPPEPFFNHVGKRKILRQTHVEDTDASWLEQRLEALKHFVDVTTDSFDVADNHRLSRDPENSYIPRLLALRDTRQYY